MSLKACGRSISPVRSRACDQDRSPRSLAARPWLGLFRSILTIRCQSRPRLYPAA